MNLFKITSIPVNHSKSYWVGFIQRLLAWCSKGPTHTHTHNSDAFSTLHIGCCCQRCKNPHPHKDSWRYNYIVWIMLSPTHTHMHQVNVRNPIYIFNWQTDNIALCRLVEIAIIPFFSVAIIFLELGACFMLKNEHRHHRIYWHR